MARARPVELDASAPFIDAARVSMGVRGDEVLELAAGIGVEGTAEIDVERVHDIRVSIRRLRAVLEVFSSCFPRERHRELLRLVKRAMDGLSPVRDLDVQIGFLDGYLVGLPWADGSGVRDLRGALADERDAAQARVEEALRLLTDGRLEALIEELDEELSRRSREIAEREARRAAKAAEAAAEAARRGAKRAAAALAAAEAAAEAARAAEEHAKLLAADAGTVYEAEPATGEEQLDALAIEAMAAEGPVPEPERPLLEIVRDPEEPAAEAAS